MAAETDENSSTLSPEAAFAVLGNETRFTILQTLWELYEPDDPANVVKFSDLYDSEDTVTFSDLYDRVGYGDSGNFNYHLEKLVGHFVRRTEDGYELTQAGLEIAQAVIAGTVRECPSIDTATIDEGCPRCGAPIVSDYENHHLAVSCSRCSGIWQDSTGEHGVLFTLPFPPTGLSGRTAEEAFHATLAYNLNRIRSFIDGVCPNCSSAVEESLDVCTTHEPGDEGGCPRCNRQHAIEVSEICRQCKTVARGPLTIAILAAPVVTAFYYDHGVEHRFASWETFRRAQTVDEEILETDPLRVRLTVTVEGDTLRLTLDETLNVVDIVRGTSNSAQ
ncbi:DUF7351 domain-containing protein [Natronoglomus mannanivorans]|uniref:Helix-turn-helix domain-containing protein n=1 Tax=Natronoglomus mannanivorans TaxID=2979990 RepID=A0AAP3E4Y5_9EURY|nr:helix-turn-helix domain-containing protein [Halobacteria archaeon AArc-xg1-1]